MLVQKSRACIPGSSWMFRRGTLPLGEQQQESRTQKWFFVTRLASQDELFTISYGASEMFYGYFSDIIRIFPSALPFFSSREKPIVMPTF